MNTATNSLCEDVSTTFNQLTSFVKEGYQTSSNYYKNHQAEIDHYTPLILKVSLYGLVLSTCFSAPIVTGGMAIAGYALADRVKVIRTMAEEAYLSLMNSPKYTEEDKMLLKIVILVSVVAAVAMLPWGVLAFPVGASIGSFLRLSL